MAKALTRQDPCPQALKSVKLIKKAPTRISTFLRIPPVPKAVLQLASITRDAMFRHIRRGDNIQSNRINPHSTRCIIQKRSKAAGVDGSISGHSYASDSPSHLPRQERPSSICKSQAGGILTDASHYAKAELAERGVIARVKGSKLATHSMRKDSHISHTTAKKTAQTSCCCNVERISLSFHVYILNGFTTAIVKTENSDNDGCRSCG